MRKTGVSGCGGGEEEDGVEMFARNMVGWSKLTVKQIFAAEVALEPPLGRQEDGLKRAMEKSLWWRRNEASAPSERRLEYGMRVTALALVRRGRGRRGDA